MSRLSNKENFGKDFRLRKVIIWMLSIFYIGCATAPKKEKSALTLKVWQSSAVIKNIKENKTHAVTLDVVAKNENLIRIDVNGPMAISLATIVILKDQTKYVLYQRKEYYVAKNKESAFQHLIHFKLHTDILGGVLWDKEIVLPNWKCEKDAQNLPKKCEESSSAIKVEWIQRGLESKTVKITGPQFEMVWSISTPTEVEPKSAVFNIKVPERFKIIQID